jgi:inorganic pyrophosphatase
MIGVEYMQLQPSAHIHVFIQNEAGSDQKHYHDEKTLAWKRVRTVSRPYPFAYGFVIGTCAEDGGNVDCFVLTDQALRTGQIVDCEAIGLMEQFEDGQADHNVLARLAGSGTVVDASDRARLSDFVNGVFSHVPGKNIVVGAFLDSSAACSYIADRSD